MMDTKSILTSKTVIGIVVAGMGMIAPLVQQYLGVTVTGDDGASLLDGLAKVAESVGLLFALYGRVVATKQIG